jgi:hypothetical protein
MVEPDADAIATGVAGALADSQALEKTAEQLAELVARDYLWSGQAMRYELLCRQVLEEVRQ